MTSRDLGKTNTLGLSGLIKNTVFFAVSWELVAATILTGIIYFKDYEQNLDLAFIKGIYFSIMGFCNAGMSLHTDSLSPYLYDYGFQAVFMIIATVGGLGFVVLSNISSLNFREKNPLKRRRLSLHARVVLIMTAIIILSTFIITYLLERNGAFAELTESGKIMASGFHAMVSRNAGFCTIPTNNLSDATLVWTMLIMFIGGAPGSTAGGIKVTTLAVIIATLHSASKDRKETIIFNRTISNGVVRDALVILNVYLLTIFLGILLVSICEVGSSSITLKDIAFEVVSATTTTGLSTGITTQLTGWSKFWLVLCMFCGRLGPLTIVMTLARRTTQFYNKYPEENLTVG
jgi:trk system potassium uptake protein TrkH